MNFKEYYKEPIKESPDQVYDPFNSKLTWYTRGAISFGTVYGVKDLSPFFLYSLKNSLTHYDMVVDVAQKLQEMYNKHTKDTEDRLEEVFEYTLLFNKAWKIPGGDAARMAREIVNSQYLMKQLKHNLLVDYVEGFTWRTETGATEIEQDLTNPIRTQLYRNSGRIWTNAKVISFWLTEEQLTPQILDDTFNKLKIANKDSYYIDVVNMKELEKEETRKKRLPSYKLYKTRKSAPPKDDRVLTDDEIRRAQQLMAKQHGVAGAQKAKFKDELPEVGAKKYGKQMPLDVRQQVQTSESKKNV
jgi:hypothetical protein